MSAPARNKAPASPLPRKTLRLTYADDMRQLREIVRQSLGHPGRRVESFADSVSALARVKDDPAAFDVFISDHHLPKMTGLEAVREPRRVASGGKIFIYSCGQRFEAGKPPGAILTDR
jgi:CheY-like chemotaxis protein